MLKTAGPLSKITNYVMVGLLYALVVMQFLPFWTTGDGAVTMSIQEYIWWPLEKPDGPAMTKYFQSLYGAEWLIGDIVLMPCVTLICAIITFFFGIKTGFRFNSDKKAKHYRQQTYINSFTSICRYCFKASYTSIRRYSE